MSRLHPILAAVSVLVLAGCAGGHTTSVETAAATASKAPSERSALGDPEPCRSAACTPDERKRWHNFVRSGVAGVDPGAAIDLYEPFGIPIEDNGPLPTAIERMISDLRRSNLTYDGMHEPFRPPVPSAYFPWIGVHIGLDAKVGSVEGRTEPLPRVECLRRLEEIVRYWQHYYPMETVMRHPGRQPERHYMVPMLVSRQTNAYAWCELVNDWDEYELSVGFVSAANAKARDYWREVAEWPHLR